MQNKADEITVNYVSATVASMPRSYNYRLQHMAAITFNSELYSNHASLSVIYFISKVGTIVETYSKISGKDGKVIWRPEPLAQLYLKKWW